MRRFLITFGLFASACGGAPPRSDAPAPAKAQSAAAAEPSAPVPEPDAEPLGARQWWEKVALGEIEATKDEGTKRSARLGDGDDARRVEVDLAALEDPAVRDAGYRDAVDALVLALRTDRDRSSARTRLETLTKTQRGAWEHWLSWHDEHGDFLVYDPELDRVDVDRVRMAAKTPELVNGLALEAALVSDRIGQDDPLKLHLRLRNATKGTNGERAIRVDPRLVVGQALDVHVRAHDTDNVAAVVLRPPAEAPPPTTETFATLPPGASVDATIDLAPRLQTPLEPGMYMLLATYSVAGPDDALPPDVWTGEASSVRMFVRVVPW